MSLLSKDTRKTSYRQTILFQAVKDAHYMNLNVSKIMFMVGPLISLVKIIGENNLDLYQFNFYGETLHNIISEIDDVTYRI